MHLWLLNPTAQHANYLTVELTDVANETNRATSLLPDGRVFVPLHTSDRILFKRCRRKWNWASILSANLEPSDVSEVVSALWFGTGWHWCLEDYHGYNFFEDPRWAFRAYYDCFPKEARPDDAGELLEMAYGMVEHYLHWLNGRDTYRTVWMQDAEGDWIPQCEIPFEIPLHEDEEKVVVYAGTLDRLVVDDEGRKYIQDYKTAAKIDQQKLETDPQITSYLWAAELIFPEFFDYNFEGFLFHQFLKDVAEAPRQLKNGTFSKNQNQRTTHWLYEQALLQEYGNIPSSYQDFLNLLTMREGPEGDRLIRWDVVHRNESFRKAEGEKIMDELKDMLDPDLRLYPNPTRDCNWDCPFRSPCLMLDDGSGAQYTIEHEYQAKGELPPWRNKMERLLASRSPHNLGPSDPWYSDPKLRRKMRRSVLQLSRPPLATEQSPFRKELQSLA